MLEDNSHRQRLILLGLWVLLVLWNHPWSGDLRSDPLAYACIAKDMAVNNHWLFPMLDGQPYLNKPPFYFWFVALSFKLFGVSFYASQLPSLIFATIDVFFLYWIVFQWLRDYDLAFFSAFSFATTRWILTNFTANRPESLLVFSVLLGCYAVLRMNSGNKEGPYLFGLSFAIGFMTKLFFAFFLPFAVFAYYIVQKRMFRLLKWVHFYMGILLGLVLASIWFIYFEKIYPGYGWYIFHTQTLLRVTEGLDVNINPLMYATEFLKYYHPWLIFFIIGIPLLWKGLRQNEYYLLIALALLVMFIPLQTAKGKAARYLVIVTPFLSMVVAMGICHFTRVKKIMYGFAVYSVLPLFIFFWIVPVKVNPEKFRVIHIAGRLGNDSKVDYTDSLAFARTKVINKMNDLQLVEWSPSRQGSEYRRVYDFYLSGTYVHWDESAMQNWIKKGTTKVLLLTSPKAAKRLSTESERWTVLDMDKYHALLLGIGM
jgi:4-amino-4-deoxy-L-arabinose transferase-like glycosyltransferase